MDLAELVPITVSTMAITIDTTKIELRDLGQIDLESPLGKSWEKLVQENPYSGFMQSLHWARFKKATGFRVLHLGLFHQEQLLGGSIFYTNSNSKGAGFLAAPDGPVLPWEDQELCERLMHMLIEQSKLAAKNLGAMALRIAPRLIEQAAALKSFSKAPLNLIENKTLYLDLQASNEELLQSMKPKCRYNIGLAERLGVSIYEKSSTDSTLDFCDVMEEVAERNEYFVEPLAFFAAMIEELCPQGIVRIFFAEHEKDLLGALLMVQYGERATYFAGGTSNTKRNMMGGYALQWAAISAAKNAGCKHYDFWGFDPTVDEEHTYAGFSRFKSQFCGVPLQFIGTYDYVFIDKLADAVVRAMKEIPQ